VLNGSNVHHSGYNIHTPMFIDDKAYNPSGVQYPPVMMPNVSTVARHGIVHGHPGLVPTGMEYGRGLHELRGNIMPGGPTGYVHGDMLANALAARDEMQRRGGRTVGSPAAAVMNPFYSWCMTGQRRYLPSHPFNAGQTR